MKKYKWHTHMVIQETKDAVTIIFNTGQTPRMYQAGQYLNTTCSIHSWGNAITSKSYKSNPKYRKQSTAFSTQLCIINQ